MSVYAKSGPIIRITTVYFVYAWYTLLYAVFLAASPNDDCTCTRSLSELATARCMLRALLCRLLSDGFATKGPGLGRVRASARRERQSCSRSVHPLRHTFAQSGATRLRSHIIGGVGVTKCAQAPDDGRRGVQPDQAGHGRPGRLLQSIRCCGW